MADDAEESGSRRRRGASPHIALVLPPYLSLVPRLTRCVHLHVAFPTQQTNPTMKETSPRGTATTAIGRVARSTPRRLFPYE